MTQRRTPGVQATSGNQDSKGEQVTMSSVAELEQALTLAKADAAEAARVGEIARKDAERAENGWRLNAAKELHDLTKKVDAVLGERVTGRPVGAARSLSRAFLYGLPGTDSAGLILRLAAVDGRFGGLLGTQRLVSQAQIRAAEHSDGALNAALDDLECKAWSAVARRIRVCAGEVEA
jgi:hypothetical protein